MFANIGPGEAIIIICILLFFFGSEKMKELARGAGQATGELKKAKKQLQEVAEELKKTEEVETEKPTSPLAAAIQNTQKKAKQKKGA